MAAVSAGTGLYPFGPVLAAAIVIAPLRWREIYFASCLGATLGVLVFAGTIEFYGLPVVESMFPGIEQRTDWLRYIPLDITLWLGCPAGIRSPAGSPNAGSPSFGPEPHQPRQDRSCDSYWKADQVWNIWGRCPIGIKRHPGTKVSHNAGTGSCQKFKKFALPVIQLFSYPATGSRNEPAGYIS